MRNFSNLLKKLFKTYKFIKFLFLSTFSTFSHNFNGVSKFRRNFCVEFQSYDDIIAQAPRCHTVFKYIQLSA